MSEAQVPICIDTVGHSNHSMETFLRLLHGRQTEVLIDTRSSPFSRYAPQFNRDALKCALQEAGIRYGFFGRQLGGRPEEAGCYDAQGHVLYGRVARSGLFQDGLERLLAGASKRRTTLLCSEEDPSLCHRRLLIARVLHEQGVLVFHVRGDGSVQSEEELQRQEVAAKTQQLGLFADGENEERAWRSIQSVLPKVRRLDSSAD